MTQMGPDNEVIYTFEDRPGAYTHPQAKKPASYDDQQHSSLIPWVVIILGVLVLAGLAAIVILAITGKIA